MRPGPGGGKKAPARLWNEHQGETPEAKISSAGTKRAEKTDLPIGLFKGKSREA